VTLCKIHFVDRTAHGCEDQAQVNPPGDGEQADDTALLNPLPELLAPHENEDISLLVSPSPQEGQIYLSSPSEEKTNCSKIFPHLLHLNS
jgi:hypothetical protein